MAAEEKKGFFGGFFDRFKSKKDPPKKTEPENKTSEEKPPESKPKEGFFDKFIPKKESPRESEPEIDSSKNKPEEESKPNEGFLEKFIPKKESPRESEPEKDSSINKPQEEAKPKKGFFENLKPQNWFNKLKEGLEKTRKNFVFKMKGLFRLRNVIDEEFWEELEEILLTADVGFDTTEYIVDEMKKAVDEHLIEEPSHLYEVMKDKLGAILEQQDTAIHLKEEGLSIILVIGVNGTGKTTSIAKIANRYMQEGKKVIVAAADTFRAAAIEQLEVWGRKIGLEIVKHKEGADPSAVVFDAVSAALARKADILIIDTAGRLHSKVNLMKELEKINRIIRKNVPDGPHETLLVLDSTNGQNAMVQAKTFQKSMKLDGIVLTKLDGTAKGGIVISIVNELKIPVKYIGVGEGAYDLRPFDSKFFLDALFSDDSNEEEQEE